MGQGCWCILRALICFLGICLLKCKNLYKLLCLINSLSNSTTTFCAAHSLKTCFVFLKFCSLEQHISGLIYRPLPPLPNPPPTPTSDPESVRLPIRWHFLVPYITASESQRQSTVSVTHALHPTSILFVKYLCHYEGKKHMRGWDSWLGMKRFCF